MSAQASQKQVDKLIEDCVALGWTKTEDASGYGKPIIQVCSPMSKLSGWATLTVCGRKVSSNTSYSRNRSRGLWSALYVKNWITQELAKYP